MMFLEMSRVENHGGGEWVFPNCVWSPAKTKANREWPFWQLILSVRKGDMVLHLRGVQPNAYFVGYSYASSDGYTTTNRPPDVGKRSYSHSFLRADLENYIPFQRRISLTAVFDIRRLELEQYFDRNKAKHKDRRRIFYVRQAGRLQCLNGAYFSEVDEELFSTLFDIPIPIKGMNERPSVLSVETSQQLKNVRTRLGQANFSRRIKELYGYKCCFPSCDVNDPRFLVGAHIARWGDNEELRGHLGNGLCLCVFHDKAFELGLFTLDEHHRVYVNPRELEAGSTIAQHLQDFNEQQIKLADIRPLDDALLEHWLRIGVSP